MTTKMLEKALEIEGLIRIIRDRIPSPEVYSMLTAKSDELAAMAKELEPQSSNKEAEEEPQSKPQQIPDSAIQTEEEEDVRMEMAEEMENEAESNTDAPESSADDDIFLTLDDEQPAIKTGKPAPKPATTGQMPKRVENLKAWFSLNDRFLYARELFNGDMKSFDSTLKTLEGATDFTAIEDYFYNEMDWDPENEYVKSFMEILRGKF